VKDMMKRIRFAHDSDMDQRFPPDRPSRITVALRNGSRLTHEVPYPKGDYRSPLADDELAAKLRTLSTRVLTGAQQERVINCALNFHGEDVQRLLAACMPNSS
jgi:2-methylcitrate dehydratase